MTSRELIVLIWGIEAGRVWQDARGRRGFRYDETWRARSDSVPLSISMPLAAREHEQDVIDAYLWGLLPDNGFVIERWATRFQTSSGNPFALLSHVGEDCAGAVQLVRPDRLAELRPTPGLDVDWIEVTEVERRLQALQGDPSAWRRAGDKGQFSLAGAQPKLALLLEGERWGIPRGRTPTTHILKPSIPGLDGHVENEHICLLLARAVGLPTAGSEVRRFGDQVAIVVARYDRVRTSELRAAAAASAAGHAAAAAAASAEAAGDASAAARAAEHVAAAAAESARAESLGELARSQPILRLHQEDLCQALAVKPSLKYQNEGGPSPADVVALLRGHSSDAQADLETFVGALSFNWLTAGTDAHAKNYSILLSGGGRARLAPLYDLGSALPYPTMDERRIQLAMKIGSKYRVSDVRRAHWHDLAQSLGMAPDAVLERVAAMAESLAAAIPDVQERVAQQGLAHPIIEILLSRLTAHVERCASRLAS